MKKINLRYTFQSIDSEQLKTEVLSLSDIEMGAVQKIFQEKGYKIIGRDIGSGTKDIRGVEIFDNDLVVATAGDISGMANIVFEKGAFAVKIGSKVVCELNAKNIKTLGIKVIGNKCSVPNWINLDKDTKRQCK